jgi:hypothetical protein
VSYAYAVVGTNGYVVFSTNDHAEALAYAALHPAFVVVSA